ncbi:hypothetical protein [Kocuria marina]|uniref:hypothetical protein n=1 Tax=Kocuria marina TaxID=223184 RepID=UPI0022E7C5AD|nr:hypothetical protein [Kocuria marina]
MSASDPASARHRPGSALSRAFPVIMIAVAAALALWVGFGRGVAGLLGSLTPVYAAAIGLPILLLHVIAAALFRRDALNYPSHAMSRRGMLTAVAAWVIMLLFGFFLPDSTAHGMQSLFTHVVGAEYVELSYGFVNIFGVLSVALAVALVLLALTDLRVTARRLRGEPLTEDERLDRLAAYPGDHGTPTDATGAGPARASAGSSSRERL